MKLRKLYEADDINSQEDEGETGASVYNDEEFDDTNDKGTDSAKLKDLEAKINKGYDSDSVLNNYIKEFFTSKFGSKGYNEVKGATTALKQFIKILGAGTEKNYVLDYLERNMKRNSNIKYGDNLLLNVYNLLAGKVVSVDDEVLYNKNIYTGKDSDVIYKLKAYANISNPDFVARWGLFKKDKDGNVTDKYITVTDLEPYDTEEKLKAFVNDLQTKNGTGGTKFSDYMLSKGYKNVTPDVAYNHLGQLINQYITGNKDRDSYFTLFKQILNNDETYKKFMDSSIKETKPSKAFILELIDNAKKISRGDTVGEKVKLSDEQRAWADKMWVDIEERNKDTSNKYTKISRDILDRYVRDVASTDVEYDKSRDMDAFTAWLDRNYDKAYQEKK